MPQLVSPFACDAAHFLFTVAAYQCAIFAGSALRYGKAYKLLWLIPAMLASIVLTAFFTETVTDPDISAYCRYQHWWHSLALNGVGTVSVGAIFCLFQKRVPTAAKSSG